MPNIQNKRIYITNVRLLVSQIGQMNILYEITMDTKITNSSSKIPFRSIFAKKNLAPITMLANFVKRFC